MALAVVCSKAVILQLFIHFCRVVCEGSVLGPCFVLLCVLSSFVIISLGMRERESLLLSFCWVLGIVSPTWLSFGFLLALLLGCL